MQIRAIRAVIQGRPADAKDNPYVPSKGALGCGARLLTEFVRVWAER
jgi:hypothetical protein